MPIDVDMPTSFIVNPKKPELKSMSSGTEWVQMQHKRLTFGSLSTLPRFKNSDSTYMRRQTVNQTDAQQSYLN